MHTLLFLASLLLLCLVLMLLPLAMSNLEVKLYFHRILSVNWMGEFSAMGCWTTPVPWAVDWWGAFIRWPVRANVENHHVCTGWGWDAYDISPLCRTSWRAIFVLGNKESSLKWMNAGAKVPGYSRLRSCAEDGLKDLRWMTDDVLVYFHRVSQLNYVCYVTHPC